MSIFETHPKSLKSELLGFIHAREMMYLSNSRDDAVATDHRTPDSTHP